MSGSACGDDIRPPSRETVLVVDDVAENVQVLGELLAPTYRVLAARSGAQALQVASASLPDLILLDVMMEDMEGYEVLARLRGDPATRSVPVIFVTALDDDRDEQRGLDLGAADYITKPIRPAVVLARVRTQLALKRALDQLRDRGEALERSVRELEAFAYTVSHDLGAPLRAIRGFARVLEDTEGRRLGREGRRALDRIAENGGRMASMMDDILAYSSAESGPMTCTEVDLGSVAREIAADLAVSHPATRIGVADLPRVHADPTMIRQILGNLIGNAVKYSSGRPAPKVEIGARRRGDADEIYVRDNGVGFDPRHAERLFGLFERLDGGHGLAGSGIGLAIVKRLVERHGGRVHAESAPDEGATFAFTLPSRSVRD